MVVFILASSNLPIIQAKNYDTAQAAIDDANRFIKDNFDVVGYYDTKANGLDIIKELATNGVKELSGKSVFVYGIKEAASESVTPAGRHEYIDDGKGDKIYRALGYARDGSAFPNPAFPAGVDNKGADAPDKKWVREPWTPDKDKTLQKENGKPVF